MRKLAIGITILICFQAMAQEAKYKALFMYKFIQNFEYPKGKIGDTYTIGVIGNDEVLNQLQSLTKGRKVNGKSIEVSRFTPGASMKNLCALFLSHKSRDLFGSLSKAALENSTVLISETPGLGKKGSPINFTTAQGKLAFELNIQKMQSTNVQVSASLKALALIIE